MAKSDNAPDKSVKQLLKVTWRMLKTMFDVMPGRLIILFVFFFMTSILPFASSYISKEVIDLVISIVGGELPDYVRPILTLVILYAAVDLTISFSWAVIAYLERDGYYELTEFFTMEFLKKSSTLDLYHYEDSETNNLIQRAKESYTWKPGDFIFRFGYIFRDIIQIITSVSIVLLFSPIFFVILCVSTIPSLYVNIRRANTAWNIWGGNTERRRKYGALLDYLSNEKSLMEIRIFSSKNYIFNQVRRIFSSFNNEERKDASKTAFLDSLTSIITTLASLSFWAFAIYQAIEGNITIGAIAFYTGTASRFSNSLESLFRKVAQAYKDVKYLSDYFDFIDLENTITSGAKKLEEKEESPRIEFKHVDFSYPGASEPVLNNFELTIEPGERIAFVGENGAGKSTIVKLLSRFYDVTGGEILIDSNDIRDLSLDNWYSKFGVLFQDFNNYGFLPAKKNIGMGDVSRISNIKDIKKAARKAGADRFIKDFDHGYNQILSKRFPNGRDLSGGQWQRIALGRGFFRDAPVLILDEPTSAIDAKGESEIFERLYQFTQGKTVIIISHRFSTVRMADKIYVIDKGRIVEAGSHEELMEKEGKYFEAFTEQAKGYK